MSLPTVGRRGSRIPKLVGFASCFGVGTAPQLRHFLLLFQPLGIASQDCFQLRVWLPPITSGPAKGIDANQTIVTANLEHPMSGAPVAAFKDGFCSSYSGRSW